MPPGTAILATSAIVIAAAAIAVAISDRVIVSDLPPLQVIVRDGNEDVMPPGGSGTSEAVCRSGEVLLGGGFGSSATGVKVKDATISRYKPSFYVHAFNEHPDYTVLLVAHAFCGKSLK